MTLRFQRDLLKQKTHAEEATRAQAEQSRLEHVAAIINALYDTRCGARRGSLPDPAEMAARRVAARRSSLSPAELAASQMAGDVRSEAVSLFQRLHGTADDPA